MPLTNFRLRQGRPRSLKAHGGCINGAFRANPNLNMQGALLICNKQGGHDDPRRDASIFYKRLSFSKGYPQ